MQDDQSAREGIRADINAALEAGETYFRAIFERSPVGIQIFDMDGRCLMSNPAAFDILGYTAEEIEGMHWKELTHPDYWDAEESADLALIAGEIDMYQLEVPQKHKNGTYIWTRETVSEHFENGVAKFCVAIIEDINERRMAQEALAASEERYRLLVEHSPDPITVHVDNTIVFANPAAAFMLGYRDRSDLIGRSYLDIVHPDDRPAVEERVLRVLLGAVAPFMEQRWLRADRSSVFVEVAGTPVTFEGRNAVQVVARDITERKRAEQILSFQATHDILTGLPNRVLLYDRLQAVAQEGRRYHRPAALLLLDLNGFKDVNDTFGHEAGDTVLQEIGRRLTSCLRGSDTVARLGGDEYAVLLPGADNTGALQAAHKAVEALAEPHRIEHSSMAVTASIGIALCPEHGADGPLLLRHADRAMYRAKRGQSMIEIYVPDLDDGPSLRPRQMYEAG